MQYRRLTTALIATLALSTVSCRSSRTVTQQTHNEAVHDTVIETVTVTLTLHDTIRETTTITIQTNETGDTTKLTTNRDREKITSRDRTALQTHATTQTETQSTTKESSTTNPLSPIQPITPKSPFKPILISFFLGLILVPLIKILHRIKH
ncbi:MAG: hypothetical protein J6Y78_15480 [Paludibacteraceae bacterium]|nr:hypothetical protein [Paludibacteraceae bacterium]